MSRRKQTAPCKVQETPTSRFPENVASYFLQENGRLLNHVGLQNLNKCEFDNYQEFPQDLTIGNRQDFPETKQEVTLKNSFDQKFDSPTDDFHDTLPLNLSKDDVNAVSTPQKLEEKFQDPKSKTAVSEEEELSCTICHKTFMSKYGLLTHLEIHKTPELKCTPCDMSFSSRACFVTHQLRIHSDKTSADPLSVAIDSRCSSPPIFQKFRLFSGFSDLSFVDFSCEKFAAVSENICSKELHRLTNRDSKHFFLCKSCDRLYPTLSSLQYHMKKNHNESQNDLPPQIATSDDGDDASKASVTKFLRLKQQTASHNLDNASDTNRFGYSMDSDDVKTSPGVASLCVPSWMKPSYADECIYDTEISRDSNDSHPPLKLKLVRRRTVEDEKLLLVPTQYFIEDKSDIVDGNWEQQIEADNVKNKSGPAKCDGCGETFASVGNLEGHRAVTSCGIKIGFGSNGRRTYWCRLCNYASCEKSTILRHQRTHTGLRPYSCKICSIAFTTKANCERHIRKRHRVRISSDADVKNAVYCDHDLLRKARDGEINIPPTASVSNPGGRYFSFLCRICKATFSNRSNGVRHVIGKHAVMDKKKANDAIMCVRLSSKHPTNDTSIKNKDTNATATTQSNKIHDKFGKNTFTSSFNPNVKQIISKYPGSRTTGKRTLKAPKLIPLSKIRAHHMAAQKLASKFSSEYEEIFAAISNMQQSSPKLSTKLLSLIGSASSLMKPILSQSRSSSFTPMDDCTSSNRFYPFSAEEIDLPQNNHNEDDIQEAKKINGYGQFQETISSFSHDQKFVKVEERLNQSPKNDNFSSSSSTPESPFQPWKTSSSLFLRHFAAQGNNASLQNLESSCQDSVNCEEAEDKGIDADFFNVNSMVNASKGSNNDDPNAIKSSMLLTTSIGSLDECNSTQVQDAPNMELIQKDFQTWTNSAASQRLRDERGRYTRNPNSPFPRVPKARPSSSFASYRNHSDLPTMVPIPGGKVTLDGIDLSSRKRDSFSVSPTAKGRKCPKCHKIFPWASSLSRHIMTHTGLKPFMCAKCSMRFTTRSNLLRHAFRRHGVSRGSDERQNVLVTLSITEQKEYAEKEAQRMVDMGDAEARKLAELGECDEQASDEQLPDADADKIEDDNQIEEVTQPEVNYEEYSHYNKRYMCGLCKLPFANRSNLVRHLHRLHQITKDDPVFRSLLIKIHGMKPYKFTFNRNSKSLVLKSAQNSSAISEEGESANPTPSPASSLVNGFCNNGPVNKLKPFTCSICMIGFTKRNNAARHIQHQHNISRKSANFSNLILKNDPDGKENVDKNEINGDVEDKINNTEISESNGVLDEVENRVEVEKNESEMSLPLVAIKSEPEELANEVETQPNYKDNEEPSEGKAPSLPETESSTLPWKNRRRSLTWKKIEEDIQAGDRNRVVPSRITKKKDIRLTHFICGVCKRIFKEVSELKVHLEEHNIPHPWHCTVCGVPFTNKYNCQRHLMRRHGLIDVEPKYVEDERHGPQPRKKKGSTKGRTLFKIKIAPKPEKSHDHFEA